MSQRDPTAETRLFNTLLHSSIDDFVKLSLSFNDAGATEAAIEMTAEDAPKNSFASIEEQAEVIRSLSRGNRTLSRSGSCWLAHSQVSDVPTTVHFRAEVLLNLKWQRFSGKCVDSSPLVVEMQVIYL